MKDKSNERILAEVSKLAKVMDKEGRGFIFAPLPKETSNHRTFVYVASATNSHDEFIQSFWAGMLSIIMNVHTQIPEDLLPLYKQCFKAFLLASMKEFNMELIEL